MGSDMILIYCDCLVNCWSSRPTPLIWSVADHLQMFTDIFSLTLKGYLSLVYTRLRRYLQFLTRAFDNSLSI
jgi:hypothetical protein